MRDVRVKTKELINEAANIYKTQELDDEGHSPGMLALLYIDRDFASLFPKMSAFDRWYYGFLWLRKVQHLDVFRAAWFAKFGS